MRRNFPFVFMTALAFLVVLGARPFGLNAHSEQSAAATARTVLARGALGPNEQATIDLFKRA